jgi:hypothetical protein
VGGRPKRRSKIEKVQQVEVVGDASGVAPEHHRGIMVRMEEKLALQFAIEWRSWRLARESEPDRGAARLLRNEWPASRGGATPQDSLVRPPRRARSPRQQIAAQWARRVEQALAALQWQSAAQPEPVPGAD